MTVTPLTDDQLAAELSKLPDWAETGGQIQRTYEFDSFPEAVSFVNKVAEIAESDQHHPDILIRYTKVTLSLSTHDAGGITSRDFELASKADGFA